MNNPMADGYHGYHMANIVDNKNPAILGQDNSPAIQKPTPISENSATSMVAYIRQISTPLEGEEAPKTKRCTFCPYRVALRFQGIVPHERNSSSTASNPGLR